jgi:hypothetical protein
MKTCIKCEKSLSLDSFSVRSDSGKLFNTCKDCTRERQRAYNAANAGRVRDKKREWYHRNRDAVNDLRNERIKKETPEQAAKRKAGNAAARKRYAAKKMRAYLEEHGELPLCMCGCGERVKFTDKGDAQRYVFGHLGFDKANEIRWNPDRYVAIEKFREVLQRVRAERGWSIRDLSVVTGTPMPTIKTILYDKRKYSSRGFPKDRCEIILRRIYNVPANSDESVRRNVGRSMQIESKIEREYGVR